MNYSNRSKLLVRDLSESLGKLPPSDLSIEEAVLGAIMLETSAMPVVATFLKPDHFYSEQNREIFNAAMELFTLGEPIDMRTVISILRKSGKIELVGGAYYVAEVCSKVSRSDHLEFHARLLYEFSLKRELIQIASSIHHKAYEDETDAFELKDFAAESIEGLTGDISNGINEKSVKDVSIEAIHDLQNRMNGVMPGISTGFLAVDNYITFNPGDLLLFGGRPGFGKSILAFQMLYKVAHDFKMPVGAFSLEMPSKKVVERLACGIAEVDSEKINAGKLTPYEFERMMEAYSEISKCTYRIDDTSGLIISDLRARVKQMVNKFGVKVVLVDYVQMLRIPPGSQMNRDQEIGVIARGLKNIARENSICIFGICSLNRGVETRGGDKRPQLQDIRDSSSLESEADCVMFIYRGEVYKITVDENNMPTHGLAEIIIAKNRNGPLGTANLRFVGKHTTFKDWVGEYGPATTSERQQHFHQHYKNPSEKKHEEPENLDTPF